MYWEDVSDNVEDDDKWLMLEGKKITMLDLQALLEISVKLNLMEDAMYFKNVE